jgi:anti-sigma factor RsiW
VSCAEFVELVTAYLDGALDPTTERRFVEHLALCIGCDRYVDQIRRTIAEMGELPADGLAPEARDQLLAAFRDWSHQP